MKRIFLLLCFGFSAMAQNSSSDPQTLQTLLTEVHQLRLALERSTQIAPRIQIAVERLKLQQDQVARTASWMTFARTSITAARICRRSSNGSRPSQPSPTRLLT